jgi:CBS domain-containing protein
MATVRKLMQAKQLEDDTYAVAATDSVLHALKAMAQANISAVLVRDGEHFVGIFTERDYARKGEIVGRNAKETRVKEVMTEKMVTVGPGDSVDTCMGLMLKYRVRHLPVVENDQIIGLVSMRDVVEEALVNKETIIAGLESYLLGTSFAT